MTLTIAQASKWLSPKRAEGGDRAPGVTSRTACPGAVSRTAACVPGEASRFRDAAVAECAFPSRRGAREVWGNPPARLRGTMENASTGQMRSSNPPPGCGAGCARVRRSRFGVWPHGKAHSAQPVGSRMRFSVRRRRVCAGEEKRTLRKGAFWLHALTERRSLQPPPHVKPHSARRTLRKTALCTSDLAERRALRRRRHRNVTKRRILGGRAAL